MDNEFIKNLLSTIYPFNKLKASELDNLVLLAQVNEYRDKDFIYRQGDPSDYLYLLLQGRVLALTQIDGQDREIELLKRGMIFGIISLFNEEPHTVTTQAIESCWVMRIAKDKFKEFLETVPMLAIDFSRVLSQRVRARTGPKKIFQCKRIGVLGFTSSGKTTYALNLGTHLKEQTNRQVICVEIAKGNFKLPSFMGQQAQPLLLQNFDEANIEKFIIHAQVDYLLIQSEGGGNVSAVLNYLSEKYHFIICELSFKLLEDALSAFVYRVDSLHLVFNPNKIELTKGGRIIKDMLEREYFASDKIKVIVNEYGGGENIPPDIMHRLVGTHIYATVPHHEDKAFNGVMRRIAREAGEVILGVALGSGGSYGFAHIGVLDILVANDVPIDVVSGTSMGSFVAAMWAAGFDTKQMRMAAHEFGKRLNLFSFPGFYFPFKGIIKAKRLEHVFKSIFGNLTFYDLKRPLKLSAFDFFQRKATVLEEGPLYKAVAASCAIPGIFEPIQFQSGLILDGGVLNPLPVKVLLSYGVHKVIAVNVTPPRDKVATNVKLKGKWNVLDFIFGSIETMQREFIGEALRLSDVVIHPIFDTTDWAQFDRTDEFIETGKTSAVEKLPEIKKLVAEI
jgi:NTE family protein